MGKDDTEVGYVGGDGVSRGAPKEVSDRPFRFFACPCTIDRQDSTHAGAVKRNSTLAKDRGNTTFPVPLRGADRQTEADGSIYTNFTQNK